MSEDKKIYRWYLILTIVYSSIPVLNLILFFTINQLLPITFFWVLLLPILFIFNIIMYILILVKKIEKIALLLPGLYIFGQIIGFVIGITLMPTGSLLMVLGSIFPLIILLISIKLLLRK